MAGKKKEPTKTIAKKTSVTANKEKPEILNKSSKINKYVLPFLLIQQYIN